MRTRVLLVGAAFALAAVLLTPTGASAVSNRQYDCAFGFFDTSGGQVGPVGVSMGQAVDVFVQNNNFLGLTVSVWDKYFGQNQSAVIAPYGSHTFHFSVFGAEPITYNLILSTASNSVVARYDFLSYYCGRQTGAVRSDLSGKCLDDYHSGTADGNKVDLWDCNGTSAQSWTWGYVNSFVDGWDETIRVFGKCMWPKGGGTKAQTLVVIHTCGTSYAQQWKSLSDGTIINPHSGLCLTDPNGNTTNGTQLQIRACDSSKPQQRWTLPVSAIYLG